MLIISFCGWLVGRSVGRSNGGLVGWLVVWLVGWSVGLSVRSDLIWFDLIRWNGALAACEFLLDRCVYVELIRAMISLDVKAISNRLHSLTLKKDLSAAISFWISPPSRKQHVCRVKDGVLENILTILRDGHMVFVSRTKYMYRFVLPLTNIGPNIRIGKLRRTWRRLQYSYCS